MHKAGGGARGFSAQAGNRPVPFASLNVQKKSKNQMAKPKLKTLKSTLPMLNTNRVKLVDTKPGAVKRMQGRAWMETRHRIMVRDNFTCAACGAVRHDHDVDHRVPLEQGGSNDDSNLQLLCSGVDRCHAKKTAQEAGERAARRF